MVDKRIQGIKRYPSDSKVYRNPYRKVWWFISIRRNNLGEESRRRVEIRLDTSDARLLQNYNDRSIKK